LFVCYRNILSTTAEEAAASPLPPAAPSAQPQHILFFNIWFIPVYLCNLCIFIVKGLHILIIAYVFFLFVYAFFSLSMYS